MMHQQQHSQNPQQTQSPFVFQPLLTQPPPQIPMISDMLPRQPENVNGARQGSYHGVIPVGQNIAPGGHQISYPPNTIISFPNFPAQFSQQTQFANPSITSSNTVNNQPQHQPVQSQQLYGTATSFPSSAPNYSSAIYYATSNQPMQQFHPQHQGHSTLVFAQQHQAPNQGSLFIAQQGPNGLPFPFVAPASTITMPSNTEIYHTGPGKFNSHGNYNGRSRNNDKGRHNSVSKSQLSEPYNSSHKNSKQSDTPESFCERTSSSSVDLTSGERRPEYLKAHQHPHENSDLRANFNAPFTSCARELNSLPENKQEENNFAISNADGDSKEQVKISTSSSEKIIKQSESIDEEEEWYKEMKAAKNRPCRFCSQTGHKDLVCPKDHMDRTKLERYALLAAELWDTNSEECINPSKNRKFHMQYNRSHAGGRGRIQSGNNSR